MSTRFRSALATILMIMVAVTAVQTSGLSFNPASAESNVSSTSLASVMMNQTLSTTQASNGNETLHGIFRISPSSISVAAGGYGLFDVNITQSSATDVLLVAHDLPYHCYAIFTPEAGVANLLFHSTLTLATSSDTPIGSYDVTVVAVLNGQEYANQIGFQVTQAQTQTSTTSASVTPSLSLSIETDQQSYQPNMTVTIRGYVTDTSGGAIAAARVSIQVDDATGSEVISANNLMTDSAGVFQTTFRLNTSSEAGTYTVFATSDKDNYASTRTHATFVVGSSSTPSVVIAQVYATDAGGNPSGIFSLGQTVLVWVVIRNNGTPFQGVIWVQILDPSGTPQLVQFWISPLSTGTSVKVTFSFTTTNNLPLGVYTANALVSDKLISQGGAFLASASAHFALTG